MTTFHKERVNKSDVLSWQTNERSSSRVSLGNSNFLAFFKGLYPCPFMPHSLSDNDYSAVYLRQEAVSSTQETMELFSTKRMLNVNSEWRSPEIGSTQCMDEESE